MFVQIMAIIMVLKMNLDNNLDMFVQIMSIIIVLKINLEKMKQNEILIYNEKVKLLNGYGTIEKPNLY